jgi:FHS family L-fucose permease-like MFS transporter
MAIPSANAPGPVAADNSATQRVALTVVTTLFFMWGFITVLNDVLVPHLKSIFDLSYTKAGLIQFAFFAAYFIFSLPSAKIVDALGYKRTMVVGLSTMGLGAFLFIPAALVPSYPLFLGALMVVAAGITALQVAANPYVAVLGPAATASSRLNLAQAFNSLGTTIGPWVGGLLILSAAPKAMEVVRQMSVEAQQTYRIEEASSVKMPYLVIGLALFALAAAIAMFKLPPVPAAERHGAVSDSVWRHRNLALGTVAIFTYVGAEVAIGSYLINYFKLPNIGNLTELEGSRLVSLYWGGAMVGRFIGSALLNGLKTISTVVSAAVFSLLLMLSFLVGNSVVVSTHPRVSFVLTGIASFLVQTRPLLILCTAVFVVLFLVSLLKNGRVSVPTGRLLGIAALCSTVLVSTSILSTGHFAMWSIILVGFFNSIMFPSIFTLGIAGLGPLTGDGSGLLVMAIVGGAIIPPTYGFLADHFGLQHAFILPAICYLYIVYYAFKGSEPTVTA